MQAKESVLGQLEIAIEIIFGKCFITFLRDTFFLNLNSSYQEYIFDIHTVSLIITIFYNHFVPNEDVPIKVLTRSFALKKQQLQRVHWKMHLQYSTTRILP